MKKSSGLFILFLLTPPILAAAPVEKTPRLAVMNFKAMNCPAAMAGIARNAAEMKLFTTGFFEILEHQQIDKLLSGTPGYKKEKCQTEDCLNKIGKLLKARYMIAGTVEKLDGWHVSLRVFEIKSEKIIITATVKIDEKQEIRKGAREAAEVVAHRLLSNWRGSNIKKYDISSAFIFALPLGHLSRICSYGYGFDIQGSVHNLFIKGFFAGGLFSFIHYRGIKDTVHHSWMTALQAAGGYGITFTPVSIRFHIAAGIGYNRISYYEETGSTQRDSLGGFQPVLRSGVSLSLKTGKYFWFAAGAAYGHIFDPGGSISWIQFQLRAALLF